MVNICGMTTEERTRLESIEIALRSDTVSATNSPDYRTGPRGAVPKERGANDLGTDSADRFRSRVARVRSDPRGYSSCAPAQILARNAIRIVISG